MDCASYVVETATSMIAVRRHRHHWRALYAERLEDNLYSAPEFLESALAHYGSGAPFRVLFVYRLHEGRRDLVACAPLELPSTGPETLLRTVGWWSSPHSYLSQPLVHRRFGAAALSEIGRWLSHRDPGLSLLKLPAVNLESSTWQLWQRALNEAGSAPLARYVYRRPVLRRLRSFDEYLTQLSPRRRKSYRRQWRALSRAGDVDVIVHRGLDASAGLAARFLSMEAAGWKGDQKTALACSRRDSGFFRELVTRYAARGELFCVELRLDECPIAMSCSFIDGATLFGFKIAHDPRFAAFSPGAVTAVQEVRAFLDSQDLTAGDSGSSAGGFIRSYWREGVRVGRVLVPLNLAGQMALRGLSASRWVRRTTPREAA